MTIFNSTGGNPYTQIIFTHTLSSVALPLPLAPGCMVLFVKVLSSALLLDLLGKKSFFFKNYHSHRNASSLPRKCLCCYSQSNGSKST